MSEAAAWWRAEILVVIERLAAENGGASEVLGRARLYHDVTGRADAANERRAAHVALEELWSKLAAERDLPADGVGRARLDGEPTAGPAE